MKNIVFAFAFIIHFSQSSVFAGNANRKIDSLQTLLEKVKGDSSKVKVLDDLTTLYIQTGDYTNALKYVDLSKSMAEKVIAQTTDTNLISRIYAAVQNAWNNKGIIYRELGKYQEALKYHLIGLELAKKFGSKEGMSVAYNSLAIVYKRQGNYTEATKYYINALKISEEIGNKKGIATSSNNIGIIYDINGEHEEALKYFRIGLKIKLELGDKRGIGNSYQNIGTSNYLMKNYDEALKYHKMSLEVRQEIGDKDGIAQSYDAIGGVYFSQKKFDDALRMQLSALKINEEIGDKNSAASCLKNIGSDYVEKGDYDIAINYYNKSLLLATQIGAKALMQEAYQGLTVAYEKKNDFKNAFKNQSLYTVMKDTLLNENTSKQIDQIKAQYEFEKQEKEITLLTKDKEIQNIEIKKQTLLKNSFIGGLALMSILFFLGYRHYRTRQLLKLQTLRNKIASDLHDDVGSTLSSISIFSELAKEQSSEVTPMLEQIGDSSRKMLDAMADIVWTINTENDQFEKIILRMKSFAYELLGAKKIDFEFTVDENAVNLKLPMDVRKNLYLIFKEATNNMVKYAEADKASFTIEGNKNNLTMIIRDNGKGFDTMKSSQGNGLKNMRRRAEEIGAKLLFESEPGNGTTIQLLLQLS